SGLRRVGLVLHLDVDWFGDIDFISATAVHRGDPNETQARDVIARCRYLVPNAFTQTARIGLEISQDRRLRGSIARYDAAFKKDDPIAQVGDCRDVVGDEDDRPAAVAELGHLGQRLPLEL